MGFDLLIAGGPQNRLFGAELMGRLVEVRVEQSLDAPTRFAIRFHDDIVGGRMDLSARPDLAIGRILTIAVRTGAGMGPDKGTGLAALVRGPVLRTRAQMARGGPGSTYQVEGIDRRDELARAPREGAWSGRASDVAATLLAPVYPGAEIGPTEQVHDVMRALPQRGTDLDFLTRQAAQNGFHFWVTYDAVAERPGGILAVTERAQWRESPPPGAPTHPAPAAAQPIRWNLPLAGRNNVTRFRLDRDGTRPDRVRAATQSTADGMQDALTEGDAAALLGGAGRRASQAMPARFLVPRPQGDAQTARTIHRAALRAAGFPVRAEISTTAHLYGGVLAPHDVVPVEGLGPGGPTPFRVEQVTHVVNGSAHYMDARLATDAEVPT